VHAPLFFIVHVLVKVSPGVNSVSSAIVSLWKSGLLHASGVCGVASIEFASPEFDSRSIAAPGVVSGANASTVLATDVFSMVWLVIAISAVDISSSKEPSEKKPPHMQWLLSRGIDMWWLGIVFSLSFHSFNNCNIHDKSTSYFLEWSSLFSNQKR